MNDQTVYRRPHDADNPYVVMSKFIFEDTAISWKAKGIMGYLLSRPNDWIVLHGDLVKRSPEGASAVRSAIRELEQHGYLTRERTKDEHGRYNGIEVLIHEQPVSPEQRTYRPPRTEKPHNENPHVDNPDVDNQTLLSIDDSLSNDCTKKPAPDGDDFSDLFNKPKGKPITTNLPKHAADPLDLAAKTQAARAKERQYTTPQHDDDSWTGRPVDEWCAMIGLPLDGVPDRRRAYFAKEIKVLAAEVEAGPQEAATAIRKIATDDRYQWLRSAGSPKHNGFAQIFQNVLCGLDAGPDLSVRGMQKKRPEPAAAMSNDMVAM